MSRQDEKRQRQPIEIENKMYKKIMEYISKEIVLRGYSQNRMAEFLGVSGTTLSEKLRYINILYADKFCDWLDRLGIKIFFPGEEPQSNEPEIEKLQEKIKNLEEQNELLKELLEEKKERIKGYKKLLSLEEEKNKKIII